MESSQIEMILTYVTAFLGSGVGVTIIATLIKAIANIIAKVKIAKATRLTESEKKALVGDFRASLVEGVTIDMDAQLNKAVNNRFTSIEKLLNEVADQCQANEKTARLIARAMSQFKTISSDIKNELDENAKLLDKAIEKIEVVEDGTFAVKEEPKQESKMEY